MMEVVIVDDGNRLTVYELVERVIPCIIAKHYSENYIQGFRSTFRNLLAYCNKNEKKYFTAELAQQFMLDCYGVQPGTVERRCSRVHRAMDLLSDYQHFNAVMLRRRLNREFPAGLQEGAVNYLQKLSLHGRRENTLRSHRNVLLRFTDYLFSVGVTDYKLLSADIVNRYVKVVSCNYSNSVVRLHYSILLRFFQYLAHLSTFIFSLIRAVGLILLGWGIVQVGLSLQSHDPSQRSQGFLTLAGGLVITFAKEILDLITA